MRTTTLPQVDQLITMNTDALALLGNTMCDCCQCVDATLSSHIYIKITVACVLHMCPLQPICLVIICKHNSMIFELPAKSARQQFLKDLISPDHMVTLELGVAVIQVLMENQDEGIFYPTAGSGSTIPPDQAFKQRSTRHKNNHRTNDCTGRKQWKPFGKFTSNLGKDLPLIVEYFTKRTDCFKAVQLTHKLCAWRKITSDSEVLQTVCGQEIEFINLPHQIKIPRENRFSEAEQLIVEQEIKKLLSKGIIATSAHEPDEFISPIFLRPKPPDGSHRLILNLKSLNEHVVYSILKWIEFGMPFS